MATPNDFPVYPGAPNYFSIHTYHETVASIRARIPADLACPTIGIVCGSGLGGLASCLEGKTAELPYTDIPHFAQSTVHGHAGKLVFGRIAGKAVVVMLGRKHLYEGHSLIRTTYPIRIMKLLGVEILLVTNAAGGLNPDFSVGNVMVISDHLSLMGLSGQNPLIGKNIDELGPRFPPVSDAYDFHLRILLIQAAARLHLLPILREGVYTFVAGPSFETRAEARFIRDVGGDCVGMSTVPEVLVARHAGVRVVGLSLITNKVSVSRGRSAIQEAMRLTSLQAARANGTSTSQLERAQSAQDELITANHEEVLASSAQSALDLQRLVVEWIRSLPPSAEQEDLEVVARPVERASVAN